MPDFAYTALAKTGAKTTGTVTAGSDREAAQILDGRGLFPIQITITAASSGKGGFRRGVSSRALATFYAQLADLLHSGVPLLRSLELLEKQSAQPRLAAVLREVRMKVADGTGLAQAMAMHPKIFGELAVSMVRAGQEGGFLEDVLKRTATFVEHQEDLKAKVVGALAYPVFLAGAGFLVLNVLVFFFIPQFADIFAKMKSAGDLPVITQGLLGFSSFMQSWPGLLAAGLSVVALVAFVRWTRSPTGRPIADKARIKLPLLGPVTMSLALSRFTRILGTLLQNGIPILRSLQIAKDATGNLVLAKAIQESAEHITAGQKLAEPLRRCGYFPPDVVEMIAIGEESNNLETVLLNISEALEKRTSRSLELSVKLLEPIMLLVMAGVVLLVVAGLLMPIMNMSGSMGK
jgi:general secretion pathway protein F